jgi:aerobic-type carbon monoxide dehydrogenase small subunit (CoxS/CutS family)
MVPDINGREHEVNLEADAELLNVLRNDLDLTCSKYSWR